jgi:hypothetical protein
MGASPAEDSVSVMEARGPLVCQCGHDRDAHSHYRRGSECALCECARWSPPGWWRRLLQAGHSGQH